jgi:phage protein U
MFAAFGPISFAVIASPTKLDVEKKFHYAKILVIGSAPIPQWIYDDLKQVEITIGLHQMWCNPQTAIQAIAQFAAAHQPQQFVFANNQSLGMYVISQMRVKNQWLADDGTVIYATVDLELTEWVSSPLPGGLPVPTYIGNPAIAAPVNPPGLTTSQSPAPGSTLVVSPATASPSGIPANSGGYADVPLTTVARFN